MKKIYKVLVLVLVVSILMASCGGKASQSEAAYYYDDEGYYNEAPAPMPASSEAAWGGSSYDAKGEEYGADYAYTEESYNSNPNSQQGLIMTFSASLDVETLDFETSMASLQKAIRDAGGYISNQYRSGGYTNSYGSYVRQSAELTIKVPASRFQEFVEGINNCGSVKSVNTWQEDITSGYLDTQARLQSLNAQKDRLTEMMGKAETVADLIQIEQQLSNTIYQIESYTSQMKVYQNLADYSTVTVYLNEVTVVTSNPITFGQRIVDTFRRTGRNIVYFFENLVLGLIEASPVIVFLAVLTFIIVKVVKARKARKQKEHEQWVASQQAAEQNRGSQDTL